MAYVHQPIWHSQIDLSGLSAQYQYDAKWVGKQKGILHFRSNSIVAKLFIIRRWCTMLKSRSVW